MKPEDFEPGECEACGQLTFFKTYAGPLCNDCWKARQRIARELELERRARMRQERAN